MLALVRKLGQKMEGYPFSSEYLLFVEFEIEGRKTRVYEVRGRRSDVLLGMVKWYGPWRQFCFYPEATTIFNNGCLSDLTGVITHLNAEVRAGVR